MKYYYLFGTDAVRSYLDGEAIGDEYGLFCYDPLEHHPSNLLYEYDGWGDYCIITEAEFNELKARKEVNHG